jgi:transcriptional regulator of arginine metabolism
MNKSYRQGQIAKLIAAKRVHTQQELARQLKAAGIAVTQVTLSRDMRELGLVKTPDGYRLLAGSAPPPAGPLFEQVIREFLVDVRAAQQLLVLRTPPGGAMPVARVLDQAAWPEIIGTVAGDDTVFVVSPDAKTAALVQRRLRKMMVN